MAAIMHNVQQAVKRPPAQGAFAGAYLMRHTVAMRLAKIRQSKNLSQRALADMVGVDASTITRAEKLSDTAMLRTYKMCAQALGVSLSDLFADDRAPIEQELLEAFRRIPESRHRELVGLLRLAASQPESSNQ